MQDPGICFSPSKGARISVSVITMFSVIAMSSKKIITASTVVDAAGAGSGGGAEADAAGATVATVRSTYFLLF